MTPLATVNRSAVFIRFSRQTTYANVSHRLLVFKGLMQDPLKSMSAYLPKWTLEQALTQLS